MNVSSFSKAYSKRGGARSAFPQRLSPLCYTETMKYKVVLHPSEEGYAVSVPGLPGCWSQGDTEAEALENVEAAIREYLSVVTELTADQVTREVVFW